MISPEPEIVLHLFPEERKALLILLSSLTAEQWATPTDCAGWSVKDVALHLLGDDIGILNNRDEAPQTGDLPWEDPTLFVQQNQLWVEASRRISTALLIEFLQLTGEQTNEYFNAQDLYSLGRAVRWAGPEPAPVWLDMARVFTERWVHQQYIRDAMFIPGLKEPAYLTPILNILVRALPHTYRTVQAEEGASVHLILNGSAGGEWYIVKSKNKWELFTSIPSDPDSTITLDQDTAWRLFTKGISKEKGLARCDVIGDIELGLHVLNTVSMIA